MIKRFESIFLCISVLAMASAAQAQTAGPGSLFEKLRLVPYVQGSLAAGHISSPGATGMAMNLDGSTNSVGVRATAGVQLNYFLGLEGTWFHLPSTHVQTSVGEAKHEIAAYVTSVVASVPVNKSIDVLGRIGFGRSDVKVSVPTTSYQSSSRQNLAVWGLGARFSINKPMDITLDYDNLGDVGKYALGDRVKLNMLSLGLRYKF